MARRKNALRRQKDLRLASSQYRRALRSMYDPDNSYYDSQLSVYRKGNALSGYKTQGFRTIGGKETYSDYALNRQHLRENQLKRAYQNRIDRINSKQTKSSTAGITAKAIGGQG